MSREARVFALFNLIMCAVCVAAFVKTGIPFNAGLATFWGGAFLMWLVRP